MRQHLINLLTSLVDLLCNCEYSTNALPLNDAPATNMNNEEVN